MPTRTLHRIFCKKCNDYTLHDKVDPFSEANDWKCTHCGTIYTTITYGEIPEEKLEAQRERYKKQTKESYMNIFQEYMRPSNPLLEMFMEDITTTKVVEADAGQKYIDDKAREERNRLWEERELKRQAEREDAAKYVGLTRNDKCACGSELKFKKCCLPRIQSYK